MLPARLHLHRSVLIQLPLLLFAVSLHGQEQDTGKPIRAGMIGLDTSHVPAFVGIFNNAKAVDDLAGITIVAGYPGGTDLPASRDRVGMFTEQIRAKGVQIVNR